MRSEVLTTYGAVVASTMKRYGRLFRQIAPFATDEQDQNTVSYNVTKLTLDKLQGIADEKIGFVPIASLPSGLPATFRYNDIKSSIEKKIQYGDRLAVEQDQKVVQFIPVAVFKQKGESRFFVARKSQKAVSAKSPERDKILAWFGGHVREEDSDFLPDGESLGILKQCVYREVKEEVGIDVDPSEDNPYCIWVRDGRSNYHLAVVFLIERDLKNTRLSVDGEELVKYEKKGRIGTGSILTAKQLRSTDKVDSWTTNILDIFDKSTEDASQPNLI